MFNSSVDFWVLNLVQFYAKIWDVLQVIYAYFVGYFSRTNKFFKFEYFIGSNLVLSNISLIWWFPQAIICPHDTLTVSHSQTNNHIQKTESQSLWKPRRLQNNTNQAIKTN